MVNRGGAGIGSECRSQAAHLVRLDRFNGLAAPTRTTQLDLDRDEDVIGVEGHEVDLRGA